MPFRPKDPPLLLKIEEAAQMLGVSRSALYRDVKLRGRWATCTVPYGAREVRFSRLALLAYLAAPKAVWTPDSALE